jgi:Fe-S-cluster containining protein
MQENLSEYGQLFFNDGYQLGKEALKDGPDDEAILRSVEKMYHAIDQLIGSLSGMAQKHGNPVHCKKGCAWCCHQAVFASSHELHYLGNFIKGRFSDEEIALLRERAKAKNKTTSILKKEALLNYKSPCPLLKNGACSAYEARPMACRIYLSTNVNTCIEFFNKPENENSYPALLEFPLQAGRMMNEGFMKALKEGGTDSLEFRLEDGLSRLASPNLPINRDELSEGGEKERNT